VAVILADTSVLIDYLNKREPHFGRVRDLLLKRQLATTVITRYELLVGSRPASEEPIRSLLAALPCRPIDVAIADRAGALGNELERTGQRIGAADTFIAAIALVNGDALLTGNRQHFSRVNGLDLVS
jgi:tRNA(fMet)-specific endonuclease VapC